MSKISSLKGRSEEAIPVLGAHPLQKRLFQKLNKVKVRFWTRHFWSNLTLGRPSGPPSELDIRPTERSTL
ncbi:hypothetical protein [White spot syndrome virus]|uniref:Uncharacterized protein n=1 Tax=White spot syndrome virus TaxID=342409 RepID=A0A2R2XF82_9VIRU|nr:hypothetical protein [White spot syndrome virus]